MSRNSNLWVGLRMAVMIVFVALVTGCASSQVKQDQETSDPIEPANRAFFSFNETLDKYLIKPAAQGYVKVTPVELRSAVTHFFDNVAYLNVILNEFLQGKVKRGFSDVGRFLVNSTIGIGGLVDVATDMGMPVHEEDLGQTLAVWGASQGAYLYLPVRGPETVRDLPDIASSALLNPLTYITGVVLFPLTALRIVNLRANLLDETNIRDEAAVDKYSFTREAYLQRRQYLIYDGNPPAEGYDEIFEDESKQKPTLIIK